jgi:hypothetical protein
MKGRKNIKLSLLPQNRIKDTMKLNIWALNLQHVENGSKVTGTRNKSVFGYQMRF